MIYKETAPGLINIRPFAEQNSLTDKLDRGNMDTKAVSVCMTENNTANHATIVIITHSGIAYLTQLIT
jgi:hypothetical protein